MLVSIVGHASFQTAGINGPSMIERSYCRRAGLARPSPVAIGAAGAVTSVNTRSTTGDHRVQTPWSCASKHEVQKEKAIQHRRDAPIARRPERHRKTELEICNSHLTGEDERDRTRKQTECEREAEVRLEPSSHMELPHRRHRERRRISRKRREAKYLHRSAGEKREARHDAENAEHPARPFWRTGSKIDIVYAPHSRARSNSSARSREFLVIDAARSNSTRASGNRLSFINRSARTLGNR